jgi:hypothetical protein
MYIHVEPVYVLGGAAGELRSGSEEDELLSCL